MTYSETFTYGGETINASKLVAIQRQKQRIMVVGKKLNRIDIIGVNIFQWEIDIEATIVGDGLADLYTNRSALEVLNDLTSHAYVDGEHDGNYYIIPESFEIKDTGERGNMSFIVNFKLIEA